MVEGHPWSRDISGTRPIRTASTLLKSVMDDDAVFGSVLTTENVRGLVEA